MSPPRGGGVGAVEPGRSRAPDSEGSALCLLHGRADRDACAHCCARHAAFCGALHDEALEDLQRAVRRLSLIPGQSILLEGQPADHVFVVVSGLVSTYMALPDGRRQIIGLGMPGDFIGALGQDRYGFSAEAVTRCSICRIRIAELEKLCSELPALERRLLKSLSDELCRAQAEMLSLGRRMAPEKLAAFLLMLWRRAEHRGEPANPIRMFLNRDEIADCLGLTSGTVSRTLTELTRHGLIRFHGRQRVVLLRRDLLERLAEGTISLDARAHRRESKATE
jgi:CRP/FNR family transcriptional regulator